MSSSAFAAIPNAVPIERRRALSPSDMYESCFYGVGRPIILTDAQRGWAAVRLWSFAYFAQSFPEDKLFASDRAPLRREDDPPMQTFRVTMREYCEYCTGRPSALARLERVAEPFYANSWAPFNAHAELRSHFALPESVPDSLQADDEPQLSRISNDFTKIFLGPAGTTTRLHNDTYYTHAWLSQIRGRKLFVLYPPSDAHALHAGEGVSSGNGAQQTWFDPLAPDFERFPRARHTTAYVAECAEGETIVVPSGWFHCAVSLTPSITLMRNFFNDANAEAFLSEYAKAQAAKVDRQAPSPRSEGTEVGALREAAVMADEVGAAGTYAGAFSCVGACPPNSRPTTGAALNCCCRHSGTVAAWRRRRRRAGAD